jgi:hypothetical protein
MGKEVRIQEFLDNINVHNLEMEVIGKVNNAELNVGGFYLEGDGKSFCFDTSSGWCDSWEEDGVWKTRVTFDLFIDMEVFTDCEYDLTSDDVLSADHIEDFKARLWIEEGDYEVERVLFHFDDR